MSAFEKVLCIAQEQLAAAASGDMSAAVDRLDERAALLSGAAAPLERDRHIIEEILRLDRALSGAIREHMIAIHDEVMDGQRGRRALDGYGHAPASQARMLNAVG
jgi:hypothetical protein